MNRSLCPHPPGALSLISGDPNCGACGATVPRALLTSQQMAALHPEYLEYAEPETQRAKISAAKKAHWQRGDYANRESHWRTRRRRRLRLVA